MDMDRQFHDWYTAHKKELHADYFTYLRFSTVSAEPSSKKACLECADWLFARLKKKGFHTQLWPTAQNPVIFAEKIADPSYPTLLLYGHYDVQPVDPLDLWKSPPFEPRLEGDRVYARGASDNKGQSSYMLAGVRAYLENVPPRCNIKILIDGNEETGSEGLVGILEGKKKELAADALVIVDLGVPSIDKPAITLGMRGIATFFVDCIGSNRDLHSGAYGGLVYNPARALSEMLATCWNKDNTVAVKGFYDGVDLPSKEEWSYFADTVDYSKGLHEAGVRAKALPSGKTPAEANLIYPVLEINGITSGYVGEQVKTIIPAKASAALSCRLVPGQDPEHVLHALKKHFQAHAPAGMEVHLRIGHGESAVRTSPHSKIAKIASKAYKIVTGKESAFLLTGASIPIGARLQAACGGEIVGIGFSLDGDDIHAPNENFDLHRFELGTKLVAHLLYLQGEAV